MKKYPILFLLLAAPLALCACTQGADTTPPTANASLSLTLPISEQAELDFAVGTDGLVYLLGQDGQVLSYRADGTLAEKYDLALTQQGLTACRIAAGDGKNQISVTLYQTSQTLDSFHLCASDPHRSPFGLRLYGLADDDRDGKAKYAGILYEFFNETNDPDQEQLLQTPVLIDPEAGTVEAAETSLKDEDVVEPSADETYGMAFSDKALTIQPIGAYFSGQGTSADYVLTR